MKRKKILLVCYDFYPEISPRSFRAFELAKEFSRLGNDVTVIIPQNDYDYKDIINKFKIKIIKIKRGYLLNKNIKLNESKLQRKKKKKNISLVYKLFKYTYLYMHPNGRKFEYFWPLFIYLKKEKNKYNLTISIAQPISTHLGIALAKIFNKNFAGVTVADYGDPFSFASYAKAYYKYLEKFYLRFFDYISIPIPSALDAFEYFKIDSKIKVIPQGIDMSRIKLSSYEKKEIPYFAYAGIFYEDIRNPKILFEFLLNVKNDFRFVIYTHENSLEFIQSYIDDLQEKIIIRPFIPRETCIKELSTYDFLINIQNIYTIQSPSKLIDYALTKRPVFNFDQNNFNKKLFLDFLNGNYSYEFIKKIDINSYNINRVAKKFLDLKHEDILGK
jgi:hypothetical protein